MGISFYSVIEYKQYGSYDCFSEVRIPRGDILLPAIVFGKDGVTDDLLYPPRGMPSDFSWTVRQLFFTDVQSVQEYLAESRIEDDDETTVEEYVEFMGAWAIEQYQKNGLLPIPESFEPGWLTCGELQEVLAHEKIALSELSPEFRETLAAMQSLSQDLSAENVRLIFWCGM